ncbi:hypothetical protein SAMN05192583_0136 [Sphingomonas gellani]|uniref:PilZ domain-containing protein n=1 Tax=Sphingomonas gellani TaxID=1166340 RepID=A0A1H7YA59_9SPHN|nr:hypothetical protein [Sphingomonas gellani]SEM42079.1 hypothetical protein SAMN05192583_0136 [Sphingomonas gellani]
MATRFTVDRRVHPALVENRAALRRPTAHVQLIGAGEGAQPLAAMLLDISPFGCRMLCAGASEAGSRLVLRFDDGEEAAIELIWREAGLAGCRFERSIARTLVRRLTLALQ